MLYQNFARGEREELGMLIFKELAEEVSEVQNRLAVWDEGEDHAQDEKKLDLLLRLVAFTNSYVWLSHGKSREKLAYFLKNGYDYRDTAVKFGVSVKSIHASVSYAANRLKKRIGLALELLRSGDLVAAEREFALGTGAYNTNLFISAIHDRFVPVKHSGVDLSTCHKELGLLFRFTHHHFGRVLDALDQQKLEHLLFVLSHNDRSYMTERSILFRCLEGEFSPDEALALLRDFNIYSAPTLFED